MKNLFRSLTFLLAGIVLLDACIPTDNPGEQVALPATTVALNPEAITVAAEAAETVEVEVVADGAWAVLNSLSWVSVTPKLGDGNATVKITVADNKDKDGNVLAPRSGSITFLASETVSAALTINQDGNNDLLIKKIPYTIDFTAGNEDWTIDDGTLPEGLTYVWSQTSNYGMKASAYVNSVNNPTDAYLISPVFDLTAENVAILSFSHARKYGELDQLSVVAKKADDAAWTVLPVENWPDGSSWDFIDSGEIDLSAFCGSKMQVAFRYTSSDSAAATWEIKEFRLTNDASPKFEVSPATVELKAVETTATVKVAGNVEWTVTCPEGVTASPAEGKGGATVTVTVPVNTDLNAGKEYAVKFVTAAAVDTKEFTVTIKQEKAEPAAAMTVAELCTLATAEGATFNATIKDVVVTYVNGNAAFCEDATAGIEIYASGHGLNAGDVLNGTISGTIKLYQGWAEITAFNKDGLTVTTTETIPCTTLEASELLANSAKYVNMRVMLKDVVVTTGFTGKANGAVKQGDTEIVVRGGVADVKMDEGAKGDLICYPQLYKEALQAYVYENDWFTGNADQPEPEKPVYKTCAEANAGILAGVTSFICNFETPVAVTLMASDEKSIYLMDADNGGGLLIYNAELFAAAKALKVDGNWGVYGQFEATATVFKGLPEITAATIGADNLKQIWKYPCKNLTIEEFLKDASKWYNCKVKIDGVKVVDGWHGAGSDLDGKVSDGTNELAVRAKSNADPTEVKTGCEGNIVAWPAVFNDAKQLNFWPHPEAGKTFFTVTKDAPNPDEPEKKEYKTCAEANAAILAGETSFTCNFETPVAVTLMASDNKSIYLMDADNGGGLLIYNADIYAAAKAAGVDGNWGVKGSFDVIATVYNGLPEITAAGITAANLSQIWKYPCKTITLADLLANYDKYYNCKVKIDGVKVTDGWHGAGSDLDGKVSDGTNELAVRAKSNTDATEVKTDCEGNIVAWPAIFKESKQLNFWPHPEAGKTFFTVTKDAPNPDEPEVKEYKNCGEINAAILAGETSLKINLESPAEITLMGADNKTIFVQDATGGVQIYSADLYTAIKGAGASAGYAVKGAFTATATLFNGLPEITAAVVTADNITGTWKFPCKNLTIADILADASKYYNCKVKIDGVEVTDGWNKSDKNGKISQNGSDLAVYVKNGTITDDIPAGAKGAFVGYVGINNGTTQVTYWEDGKFIATSIPTVITAKTGISIAPGETKSIEASVNSGATLSFASDKESVATVSADGVVTGVADGEATITITAPAKDKYAEATATCKVTVKTPSTGEPTVIFSDDFKWVGALIEKYNEGKEESKVCADFVNGTYATLAARIDAGNTYSPNISTAFKNADGSSYGEAALAEAGYTHLHGSTYQIYPQGTVENPYLKFCKSKTQDGIKFKPFKEAESEVTLSVDWSMHMTSTALDDTNLQVIIEGEGEFENGTKTSDAATHATMTAVGDPSWSKATFVIRNVNADTVVKISCKQGFDSNMAASGQRRFYIDNLVITK